MARRPERGAVLVWGVAQGRCVAGRGERSASLGEFEAGLRMAVSVPASGRGA